MENEKTKLTGRLEKIVPIMLKILPGLPFVASFVVLYFLDSYSFELTWKGRTYYLFFLWLFSLETILVWEEIRTEKFKLKSIKTICFIIALSLPIIYVLTANYLGLNRVILNFAEEQNIALAGSMPLSIEYLFFAGTFALIIALRYGTSGLKNYSISMVFLAAIGVVYVIDNLYPYGRFTPFQILVPTTTVLAASVLNLMGYRTSVAITTSPIYGETPSLSVWDPSDQFSRRARFNIAWPCSGIESLLIYTVTIVLFLKKAHIPLWQKITYFVIGALVTYFINILRIALIFLIQINEGDIARSRFHDYYGQLLSITWIILYPLIIIGTRAIWRKFRSRKASVTVSRPPEEVSP